MEAHPLNRAACSADLKAVQALLQAGEPIDALDELGHSALHWAVFGGYEDIVQALLHAGANPNVLAGDGVTPKWRAADFGLLEIERLLAEYGGIIATDENFDRKSFQAFNDLLGLPLPQEQSATPPSLFRRVREKVNTFFASTQRV